MKNMWFLNDAIVENYLKRNGEFVFKDIYKIDDMVIKKINIDKSKSVFDDFSLDKLLQFKDIDIECFSFIKFLVYTGFGKVYGTGSKYINGINIHSRSLGEYNIDNVLNGIKKLELSIRKLSDMGICVNDINFGNVIFNGKNIKIIDTAEYYFDDKDSSDIYTDNMMFTMNTIFANIFYLFGNNRFMTIKNIYEYFNIRNSEYEHFCEQEYLLNPVDTLSGIRKLMEEDFGVKLNSFSECHEHIGNAIRDDFYKRIRIIKR